MLANIEPKHKSKLCFRLALFATGLTFLVLVLGAYTRLTDAGLGCPDWPGCYGHWLVSENLRSISPSFVASKAWTEMIHRYVAGFLGIVIGMLFIFSLRNRQVKTQPIILPLFLVLLVMFQALLGMWTVTLKLYPVVVMAHLLGGFTTLSLLWWVTLKLNPYLNPLSLSTFKNAHFKSMRFWAMCGLLILILQLFLGGWVSANYAALVCLDFPFCQAQPFQTDFNTAFNLTSAGVTGSLGEPLSGPARMTIHMVHRYGALLTTSILVWLSYLSFSQKLAPKIRVLGIIIAFLLIVQISLGIGNVLLLLPLPVAIGHNAVGALLLLAVITLNYFLFSKNLDFRFRGNDSA